MRVFNKAEKTVKLMWDSVEYTFLPGTIQHVRNYDIAKELCKRQPNLVDYDEWMEVRDKLVAEGHKDEADAMRLPVKEGFELPHVDDPHSCWMDRAISLGMRGVGRGTPKESLIEFCRAALGAEPGEPIPAETRATDRVRQLTVASFSPEAREAMENAGVRLSE